MHTHKYSHIYICDNLVILRANIVVRIVIVLSCVSTLPHHPYFLVIIILNALCSLRTHLLSPEVAAGRYMCSPLGGSSEFCHDQHITDSDAAINVSESVLVFTGEKRTQAPYIK